MFAAVRDVVGGRSATSERGFAEAREIAMSDLQKKAQGLGATAVIGMISTTKSLARTMAC